MTTNSTTFYRQILFVTDLLIFLSFINLLVLPPVMAGQKPTGQGDQVQSFNTIKLLTENSTLEGSGFDTVVFDNEIWIVGGDEREGVFSSKDLIDWKEKSNQKDLSLINHSLLSFDDKMWVLLGSGLSGFSQAIWSSSDGKKWQQNKQPLIFPARIDNSAIVFKARMWVLGGMGEGMKVFDDVWSSKDGLHWDLAYSHAAFGNRNVTI